MDYFGDIALECSQTAETEATLPWSRYWRPGSGRLFVDRVRVARRREAIRFRSGSDSPIRSGRKWMCGRSAPTFHLQGAPKIGAVDATVMPSVTSWGSCLRAGNDAGRAGLSSARLGSRLDGSDPPPVARTCSACGNPGLREGTPREALGAGTGTEPNAHPPQTERDASSATSGAAARRPAHSSRRLHRHQPPFLPR